MNHDKQVVFAFGLLAILAIFYASWCRLFHAQSKWRALHIGLQFSLGSFSLLLMNLIIRSLEYGEAVLLVLFGLFIALSFYSHRQKMAGSI
ncbi:hypothetical protein OL548_13365 [Lysinibacillus sp. MHQ-1]|nr:hypothetical protein OL548_13365 [Lysinibacillus sp. MHQ-1]